MNRGEAENYGGRGSSKLQRSLGPKYPMQTVNPLNQNLEFLHTAKRAIRKLESSQDVKVRHDIYHLNTTRERGENYTIG